MKNISRVIYTSTSGPILPEWQQHEEISITREKVVLTRSGRADHTQVNVGSWEVVAQRESVEALFAQLSQVDCSRLKRIEPDDPPDGGGSESFTLIGADGKQCSLLMDPGVTYTGGEQVTAPVKAFIHSFNFPPGSVP